MSSASFQISNPDVGLFHPLFQFGFDLLKQAKFLVLLRNHRNRKWPLQSEPRVIIHQTALCFWLIELSHLVARVGVVDERLITVSKTFRHVERPLVSSFS